MLCALADAQHEGAQPGVVAAADTCAAGHGDAVPLKVRRALDAPRIRLIAAVLGKEHRAERHSALVEGLVAQIRSGVELVDLPRKLHGGLLRALVQQAVLAVLTEQRTAVGHQRLFPAVIVDAELVNDAVPVRVSRQLLTQAVKLIPRPIVIRDADVLFLKQCLIDEHHLRHAFQRQRILFPLVGSGLQCRRVKAAQIHFRVLLHERIQLPQGSCIAENCKVLGKNHHHIRLLPQQVLAAEPFGVVFDSDAAGVLDFHVGVLCLKLFNGGVNKGIVVLARNIPIAVTREADVQHHRTAGSRQNDDRRQQKGQRGFPAPAHTSASGWLFWFCTAQMASWVRSRSSSLRRMLLM